MVNKLLTTAAARFGRLEGPRHSRRSRFRRRLPIRLRQAGAVRRRSQSVRVAMMSAKPNRRVADLRQFAAAFIHIKQPRFASPSRILRGCARKESRRRSNGEVLRGVRSLIRPAVFGGVQSDASSGEDVEIGIAIDRRGASVIGSLARRSQ